MAKKIKCKHCDFLEKIFQPINKMTKREYWIMTEIFVYLHGNDECNGTKNKIMKPKHKLAEQVIKERKDREELRQLRNLKRNLESGVVFDVSPKLMKILMEYKTEDL